MRLPPVAQTNHSLEHYSDFTMKIVTKEADEHYCKPVHSGLLELGLQPNYLTDEVIAQMMRLVLKHKDNVKIDSIFRGMQWL